MYSACLFCSSDLGSNEVIEQCPIGRRLAFDAHRGRLWVVCRSCQRWNLTPFEERWEAIEDSERRFRATTQRFSTDHIGLARLSEGLELVRIGDPMRPEMAAWRYGDSFGRRRQRRILAAGAALGAGALLVGGGLYAGTALFLMIQPIGRLERWVRSGAPIGSIGRVRDARNRWVKVKAADLKLSQIGIDDAGELSVSLVAGDERRFLYGVEARRALGILLPHVNPFGGTSDDIRLGVAHLEHAGSADQYLRNIARRGQKLTQVVRSERVGMFQTEGSPKAESGLGRLPTSVTLALEMALNEQQERRAMEGELAELEEAWKQAEEIAAIADSLGLPPAIESAISSLRNRLRG